MINVVWPKTKKAGAFKRKVEAAATVILNGSVLAIDPASGSYSMPGYALFTGGKMTEYGVIKIDSSGSTSSRLAELAECMRRDFSGVDVLAIEELRGGKISPVLHWSVGAIIASVPAKLLIEVPICYWKAWSKTQADYLKQDDMDARMIGETVLALAKARANQTAVQ